MTPKVSCTMYVCRIPGTPVSYNREQNHVCKAVSLFLQVPTANSEFHAKLSNDPGIGFFRHSHRIERKLSGSQPVAKNLKISESERYDRYVS